MTAAVRSEDYDSFGRVTTPQLGIIYRPSNDFSLKGSWGKSFKAPTLYQNHYYVSALLYQATALGGTGLPADATAIYVVGGDPDLAPERAKSWTTSLAFHPDALPGLEAELTYFRTSYTDRVILPFPSVSQGLSNPAFAAFVDYSPTAATQAEVIASADLFFNYSGLTYVPENVVAILHGRYVNISRQWIKGMDLSGSYRFDVGAGRVTVRGSISRLDSSQQSLPGQDSVQLAGTLFNPAKVNGRFGVVWNSGGFTASTFANYIGGLKDTRTNVEGASFSTFDATLRYAFDSGLLSGLELALSAQNLLNREPPLHVPGPQVYRLPYDALSYSAVGRFLAFSVSKKW